MSYLQKHPKSGVYWFRRAVPVPLRASVGKREIRKSLRTTDLADAKQRALEHAVQVDRLFRSIEPASAAAIDVSAAMAEAERRAGMWKAEQLRQDAECRLRQPARSEEMAEREAAVRREYAEMWRQMVAEGGVVHDLKIPPSLIVPGLPADLARRIAAHVLARAMAELNAELHGRAEGVWPLPPETPALANTGIVAGPEDIRLSEAFRRYDVERRLSAHSRSEFETALRRFREVVGEDRLLRHITKADVRDFKDALLRLPVYVPPKLRGQPVPVVVKNCAEEVPRLSITSVQKNMTAVQALLAWCVRNGYLDSNPAVGVKPADPQPDAEKRLPYSDDDLVKIFASPLYRGAQSLARRHKPGTLVRHDACYWLPLLGLYTGCRLEELGQALLSDVREEGGIAYLDINTADPGKSAKTKGSRRKVPLHPRLIADGFLDYVDGLRSGGAVRLFPDLKPSPHGKWTAAWSKWWGRYARAIGIHDRRKVFHSFRHAFKDACRRAGIEEAIHDALTGHSSASVGRRYGSGYPVRILFEAVERISFPAVEGEPSSRTRVCDQATSRE